MTQPKYLVHLDSPDEAPLTPSFKVRGWVASTERIHSIAAGADGAKGGQWLTLEDRPDVRTAHPELPHVAGFSDEASLPAIVDGNLLLTCRIGDAIVTHTQVLAPVPLPPDHLQVRQVGGVWGRAFYAEGRTMFQQIETAFRDAGAPLAQAGRILDFGCGCGRVLRSFRNVPLRGELWGSDIDAEAIAWNQAHLGALGNFRVNGNLPPAPFADEFFSVIYSVSVFTHLPEDMQTAWLEEMHRLLQPGGLLLASLHGARYWTVDPGVKAEVEARGFAYRTGTPTAGLPDFYMSAFHSEAYVRREWSRWFEVVDYRQSYLHGAHDIAVVRRRP